MHSTKILIPTMILSLGLCIFACSAMKSDENAGQTAARQVGNGNGDPRGNNGTWKVEVPGTDDEIPNNIPHVGCSFELEFRGYDQGDLQATWTLTAQAPSGNGQTVKTGTVDIGEDPAGGATDSDGVELVTLSDADLAGLTAQPQQGYHLKLEVDAEGSQGARVKHKTFWVTGCAAPDGGASSSGGSSSGGSSSGGSSSGGSSSGGSSSGGSSSGGSSSGGSSSGQTW
jgi:hypothetical protein